MFVFCFFLGVFAVSRCAGSHNWESCRTAVWSLARNVSLARHRAMLHTGDSLKSYSAPGLRRYPLSVFSTPYFLVMSFGYGCDVSYRGILFVGFGPGSICCRSILVASTTVWFGLLRHCFLAFRWWLPQIRTTSIPRHSRTRRLWFSTAVSEESYPVLPGLWQPNR